MRCTIPLIVVTLALACGPGQAPTTIQQSTVVLPADAVDLAGAVAQALACDPNQIAWSVQEGVTAGAVTTSGVFTAAACGSAFVGSTVHVVGTGCGRSATAAVAISEAVKSVTIDVAIANPGTSSACLLPPPDPDAGVPIAPGGVIQFYAAVAFTCHITHSPPLPATLPPGC